MNWRFQRKNRNALAFIPYDVFEADGLYILTTHVLSIEHADWSKLHDMPTAFLAYNPLHLLVPRQEYSGRTNTHVPCVAGATTALLLSVLYRVNGSSSSHDDVIKWKHLFTQPFIQAQIKENIKAPRHWPLCGEFTGDRWIFRTKGQWRGKYFHLMRSSWNTKALDAVPTYFTNPTIPHTGNRHVTARTQLYYATPGPNHCWHNR